VIHLNNLSNPLLVSGLRGLIFDCDGVLIDSLGSNTFFYNACKEHFGLPPMTREEAEYVHAHHVWESLARILPPELFEEGVRWRASFDYRLVLPHIKLAPGLREFLLWARSAGLKLGIATSRTDTMDLVLSHFDLEPFFSPVVTSFKVTNPKPSAESLHVVLARWGMRPDDVAFIGDSSVDEGTAINAEVRFWAYQNPSLFAELYIPDFWTLRTAMSRAYRKGFLWP
jgi:phosphoglycolate phosphatase-like HAD superfamily hydrolase